MLRDGHRAAHQCACRRRCGSRDFPRVDRHARCSFFELGEVLTGCCHDGGSLRVPLPSIKPDTIHARCVPYYVDARREGRLYSTRELSLSDESVRRPHELFSEDGMLCSSQGLESVSSGPKWNLGSTYAAVNPRIRSRRTVTCGLLLLDPRTCCETEIIEARRSLIPPTPPGFDARYRSGCPGV